MKILAFSDLHLNIKAAERIVDEACNADLVVGAGDYGTRQEGIEEVLDVLSRIDVPTILVPGNHDDFQILQKVCAGWKQATILHGQSIEFNGFRIFGLGYETPRSTGEAWNRYLTEKEAGKILEKERHCDILITHAPPLGVADQQADGSHEGSHAIREFVARRQPQLHLCGHIHNAWGMSGKIGRSYVQNLGPAPNWFMTA